ncbi:4-(cytidine 5'-diphospho)-2-C-methyl-D-erythritol kinase [Natroniella sulfidigena]|uniref:4-(cytidine 5'-diphospho)-2-C-methyl-D-erythritol kinase n=1 Tax=Natroniella sulfidigena TaxID=723921 RepID=UPI00200B4243|nr:4-(cytidine 5'-diphospho)-2-C-methyl-D-erythritol kinase [Natroniella sulfidigena]MCK8817038.1 4-(cytidine 5'-diphospho)-2-C-methyl-D-erythritol kinase [Natroniella sulfidigena]
MSNKLDLTANAKINLTLDVLAKREDGYHEVEMIMQSVNLADRLTFTKIDKGIEIEVNHPQVPTDQNNLIYQAAQLLFSEFDLSGGVRVEVDKRIPVAAGLAGGSTNAAATLVAINQLWELNLSLAELISRGAKLGADVPFCIAGGTQLATGIGTELEKLVSDSELYLVIVNPPLEVSTAMVYQNFKLNQVTNHPQTAKVIAGLREGKTELIVDNVANVLETVTLNSHPEVAKLKSRIEELTDKALMAGSGPTVLGFVVDQAQAEQVKVKLEEELATDYKIVVAKTVKQAIQFN